jgi:hypothetical protein
MKMVTWFIIIDLKGHLEIMTAMADVITMTMTETNAKTINPRMKTASMCLRFFYW